jgi:hypothetical protein
VTFSAPQPAVVHLFTIFRQIGAGELHIPAFQREFVWNDKQVIDLLTSVRQQYPIGSLLLWNVERKMLEIANHQITGFPDVPESYPTNYVLDGMQRLSTLYGTFHYTVGQHDSFNVNYDLRNGRFFHERDRTIFDNETAIPLASLMSPRRMLEHQARLAKLSDGDQLLDELLKTQAAFQDYMIPIVTIRGTDVDRIAEIFERTNSTGTRLDTVDFMRAITWSQAFDLNHHLDNARTLMVTAGFELSDETIIKCVGLLLDVPPSGEGLLSLRNRSSHELRAAFMDFPVRFRAVQKFLFGRLAIENLSYVPYEGQLLVLFKSVGMEEARTPIELDRIVQWFWAAGFNESLRGKPDHYVVRAVQDWHALVDGRIRGLEPRLRLSDDDFFERRLIRGRALSAAFATMFAAHKAKSLLTGDEIPASIYMSASDLGAFQTIFSAKELRNYGLDIGPSPRRFSNVILTSPTEEPVLYPPDWRSEIVRQGDAARMDVLASQFIDEEALSALMSGSILGFLRRRASVLRAGAQMLVGK